MVAGCAGRRVISYAAENGVAVKNVKLLNLGEGIVAHGDHASLIKERGIDALSIAKAAEELCGRSI